MEIENLSKEHEKVDQKASLLAKQVSSLEVQLADSQDTLQSETKQKLQFQVQLKQAEDRNAALQDQVEEEENARKAIEAKLLLTTSQVLWVGVTMNLWLDWGVSRRCQCNYY